MPKDQEDTLGISIPSAEEYEANRSSATEYTLLPEDDYIVEVKDIEVKKDQIDQFNRNADGTPRVRDTLLVRLRPISFLNGDELVDEHGDAVGDDRLFFAFIDPTHVGLVPVPAKARKFFAASLGVNVDDRIEIDSYSDLIGKRLVTTVVHKDGKHRITDFRLLRKRAPKAKPAVEEVAAVAAAKLSPVVESGDVLKAAKDIFEDDLPF